MSKNKAAVTDGQRVREFVRVKGRKQYIHTADEVIAIIKRHVRRTMGDWMEDNAKIFANHGTFFIKLPYRRPLNVIADEFWRGAMKKGIRLHRHSIGLALRAMHGEILT
jgi:hypothetical protein